MALPPADELSRWTVNQVNAWLTQNSLTAFRDTFLADSIDGSKLMRMKPTDIDQRYHSVPPKKRSVLKDILSKLDTSPRPSATWNSPPVLPPRPKPPPSNPSPEDSDEDDGGWSDSFDDEDDHGDYVEPTATPSGAVSNSLLSDSPPTSQPYDITFPPLAENKVKVTLKVSGSSLSEVVIVQFDSVACVYQLYTGIDKGPEDTTTVHLAQHSPTEPQVAVKRIENQNAPSKSGGMDELEVYEQVEEEAQNYGLDRKTSLFCKLKTALNQRQQVKQDPSNSDSDGESYLEPVSGPPDESEGTPPPRPPRLEKTNNTQSKSGGHMVKPTPVVGSTPILPPGGHRPPPPRPSVEPKEPEDVYEVMEEAADNVNGEEEYMEPDAPSPPEITVEKSKHVRSKLPPEPAQARKSSREESPMHPKKVVREEPSLPKSTSVPPPRRAINIPNTTPPSVNSAQATQASSKECSKEDLSNYPWFHGNIKREDADHIFAREQMEGMFLIRKSERKADQPYTLVLWHHGRMWNLPVRLREDKKYAAGSKKADESAFDSIVELVEHFKIRTLNLKSGDAGRETTVTLRQAAPKH